jgi:hypothetical protein
MQVTKNREMKNRQKKVFLPSPGPSSTFGNGEELAFRPVLKWLRKKSGIYKERPKNIPPRLKPTFIICYLRHD